MKKKWLIGALSLLCGACILGGCSAGGISDAKLEPMPALDPVYGTNPGEGIVIDGVADEMVWKTKKYFSNADTDKRVTYYTTTHLSEKGVYIYAFSSDSWVCYSNRNNYNYNTHFYFIINAHDDVTTYNEGLCRSIKIDTTAFTMPTNFRYTAASKANGEINGGNSQGMQVEVFVSWDQLGIPEDADKPEEVDIFSAYLSVPTMSAKGEYVSSVFRSNDPGTYHKYNENGYIETGDKANGLGSSKYGTAKTGGLERTDEGMECVAGGPQTAFFNMYSDKFVMTTTVKSLGEVYNKNTIAKAGFILFHSTGFYNALMFDLRSIGSNVNVSPSGVIYSNRLIKLTNHPNIGQLRTNVVYDGVDGNYSQLKLTLIKDGSTLYYAIDDKLVHIETQDWLRGKTRAGIYSFNASCVFSDYSFIDCETNETALSQAINALAYQVDYDQSDPRVYFSSNEVAVDKDGQANVDLYVKSGYTVSKLYNNNIDVTDIMRKYQDGSTLQFKNLTKDLDVYAEVKTLDDFVTIKGKAQLPGGEKLPYVELFVKGELPYTSYFTETNAKGEFEVKVQKNNSYTIVLEYKGYRTTRFGLDVGTTDVTDKTLTLENYVVGGDAGTHKSNTAAWDMSQESNNKVVLDLQDRTSGGVVYFTGVVSDAVVIDVTVTNLTNQLISEPYYKTNSNANGEYENDPGAGIAVSTNKATAHYKLYWQGYRNRLDGSYSSSSLKVNSACGTKDFRVSGTSIRLTFMRSGEMCYMYIDGNLVYYGANPNLGDADSVYAFSYDSSAILKVEFKDYSILSGDDARAEIYDRLAAQFVYDGNKIEVSDLQNSYGLLGKTPVISVKGLTAGQVAKVKVNNQYYYVNSKDNSIEYKVESFGAFAKVNVSVEEVTSGKLVSGSVNTAASLTVLSSDKKVSLDVATDENGAYSTYLGSGSYYVVAQANGYKGAYRSVSVANGAVSGVNFTLEKDELASTVYNGGVAVHSRTIEGSYDRKFNLDEMRHSVRVGQSGNGGGIYFGDSSATDIMISFKYIKHDGTETDPGFGIWATSVNEPASNGPNIRMLLKSTKVEARCVSSSNETSFATLNGATGIDVRQNSVVFDCVYIRRNNVYYLFVKAGNAATYTQVCEYTSDVIPGAAVYGLTVTAGNGLTLDGEFYDYGFTKSVSEIDARLSQLC